jgi:hypothetical protein
VERGQVSTADNKSDFFAAGETGRQGKGPLTRAFGVAGAGFEPATSAL